DQVPQGPEPRRGRSGSHSQHHADVRVARDTVRAERARRPEGVLAGHGYLRVRARVLRAADRAHPVRARPRDRRAEKPRARARAQAARGSPRAHARRPPRAPGDPHARRGLRGDPPLGGIRITEAKDGKLMVEEAPPPASTVNVAAGKSVVIEDGSTIQFRTSDHLAKTAAQPTRGRSTPRAPKGLTYLADVLRE